MPEVAIPKHPVFDFTSDSSIASFAVTKDAYLASHPDLMCQYIATGAFVFDTTGFDTPRVLLIQRSASDTMPNKWEVPGGACDDDDESILHGVARELWEETGLLAKHISVPVGDPELFLSRSGKRICKFNFMVHAKRDADDHLRPKLDPAEHQAFVWASLDEVRLKKAEEVELDFTIGDVGDLLIQAFDMLEK